MPPTYRIEVEHMDVGESPFEEGPEFVSFSRRHRNFKHPDKFGLYGSDFGETFSGNVGIQRKLTCGTAFILSCYQHGGVVWSLKGEGPSCRWDTADIAGLVIFDINLVKGLSFDERREFAKAALVVYNAWCNGSTYHATLYLDDKEVDCGWPLYGIEGVDEWLNECRQNNDIPQDVDLSWET